MLPENYLEFSRQVEKLILAYINGGENKLLRKDALEKLAAGYGIGDKTEVKELAELAIINLARQIDLGEGTLQEKFNRILELYQHQPNLSHRSSRSMIYQQYSTPAPIAFLAASWCKKEALGSVKRGGRFTKNHFTVRDSHDREHETSYPPVFEPSAGNGLFTICFEPGQVWVNEIDPFRRQVLQSQHYGEITDVDSSVPSNLSYLKDKFDIVVSNPPFDKLSREVKYNNTEFGVLDHLMAVIALNTLKPDGRAAIIVGGHTEYDELGRVKAGKNRKFINYLYRYFNVWDIINIDGKMYSRQGTSFDIRLILIDGKAEVTQGFAPLLSDLEPERRQTVASYAQLRDRIFPPAPAKINPDINSTEFKEWFSGSKIIEKNGKPLKVYHGTNHQFTHFDKAFKGRNTEWSNTRLGFFFLADKQLAINFTEENGNGNRIISAYLSIRKPLDLTIRGIFNQVEQAPLLVKILSDLDMSPRKALKFLEDEIGLGEVAEMYEAFYTQEAKDMMVAAGYDGVISEFGRDVLEYVAFEPEQILILGSETIGEDDELSLEEEARRLIEILQSELDDDSLGMAYTPVSDSCNKLDVSVPDSMAYETFDALKRMQDAVGGDVTEFVRLKLGYKSRLELCKALAAEQIDAVATAIYNIEQKGQGIIIGDQTGIGKGRQAAAIIRYAIHQGLTPVFLTEKPNLFSDLYRDMAGIGSAHYKPFIVNAKESKTNIKDEDGVVVYMAPEKKNQSDVFAKPEKLKSYDYVVSTYSQFNKNVIDENGLEELDTKGVFLKNISKGNILILDESHNAGGESNIGRFLTKCVQLTKGTVFLSATFAKRPNNMPIYATKTALQDCNMSQEEFISAFQKGGVALQEVVSAQLVQEGQMIRRERTIENLEVNYITLNDDALEHASIADKITAIMRRIVNFEEVYIDGLIEGENKIIAASQGEAHKTKGTSKAGVSNSPYFSKLFNVINQMLFSIKAPQVAQHTLAQLKAGKKVVIAFSSTMGAFLSDVEVGSVINADFSEVLERGLQNTLRYTETDADGKPTHKYFSLSSFSQAGQEEYASIIQDIKSASTGITVSPIDILIQTIRAEGYSVAEITGRDKELQYNFTQEQAELEKEKQAAKPKKGRKPSPGSFPNCKELIPSQQMEFIQDALKGEESEYFEGLLSDIEKKGEELKKRNLEKEKKQWQKDNGSGGYKYMRSVALPIFHYFSGTSDIYVYEWNQHDGLFYTYSILNGDYFNAEFGYQALSEVLANYGYGKTFEMDFHFEPKPLDELIDEKGFRGLGRTGASTRQNTMALVLARKKEDAKDSFRKFQNNEVDVLLINQSGSTGASAHAVPTSSVPPEKVKPRVMIFLQPELDINRQVQKMGRINRTGQILLPQYDYMASAIPAEQRLMMMLQKKIKSLDANTSSNQSNSSNVIDVPDFLNKYGDQVVYDYLVNNADINKMIGDPAEIMENKNEAEAASSDVLADLSHKVSGRVAVLSVKDQEHFYTNILEEYTKYVTSLKQQGKYDLQMETKNYEAVVLESTPIYINPFPGKSVFANHSYLEKVEINNLIKPYSQFEVREIIEKNLKGYKSASEYSYELARQIEEFAANREEKLRLDIEQQYADKIADIPNEKGFIRLNTKAEKDTYLAFRQKELKTARENRLKVETEKYSNQISFILSTVRFFSPGKSVLFPTATFESGASYTKAVFLGFDVNLKKENPYTPGNIYLSFAMSDSNRHFDVNLANEGRNQVDMCKGNSFNISEDYLDQWAELCAKSNKNRVERYMITGNLLQTITMKDYSNGKLVNYTVKGGGVSKGYIMPDKWLPNFELSPVSGKANIEVPVPVFMARGYIKSHATANTPVRTNTVVSFGRNFQGEFTINVPRSKQQGGFIFMDRVLLELVEGNNFNTQGNLMVAVCAEKNVDSILEHLQSVHKINILVSSEQLKSIEIPVGVAPEVQRQIPVATTPVVEEIDADELEMLELEAEALILLQKQELELLNY